MTKKEREMENREEKEREEREIKFKAKFDNGEFPKCQIPCSDAHDLCLRPGMDFDGVSEKCKKCIKENDFI